MSPELEEEEDGEERRKKEERGDLRRFDGVKVREVQMGKLHTGEFGRREKGER